jgi:uncharacterized Zn finger protein
MGCYDTVLVPCPKCGKVDFFQTKGGECLLREFKLEDAPQDVLSDVNRHAPYTCADCGTVFHVEEKDSKAVSAVWNYPAQGEPK